MLATINYSAEGSLNLGKYHIINHDRPKPHAALGTLLLINIPVIIFTIFTVKVSLI